MRRQSLNKKSLYQTGGQTQKVDPAIIDIVNSIKSALQSGEAPENLAMQLITQNIPQDQISSAFEQVGYDPAAIVDLMQTAMAQLQQQQVANQQPQGQPQEQQEQVQEPQEQVQMAYGGGYINDQLNPEVRRPLYMPLQQPQGDVFGAALTAADAFDSMFNKKTGSFMNHAENKQKWLDSKGDYSKYTVDIDPNDPNKYVKDINDIKKGKLRTTDQYAKDVNDNSRISYNPYTGQPIAMISGNPIDPNKVNPAKKDLTTYLLENGINFNDYKNIPKGTSVGFNQQGQLSSFPPVTPITRNGGGLDRYQLGSETPLSYDEWLRQNGRGAMGSEMEDQTEYQTYLGNSQNNSNNPTVVKPPKITSSMNAYGKANWLAQNPGVKGYGDAAKAGVALAGVINQGFQQSKYNDYQNKLREFTMADNIFGTSTNPVNKRGTWDVNTGLAEPNNYVTGSYAEGGEIHDVDMKTLTQLIAAGADIKIL